MFTVEQWKRLDGQQLLTRRALDKNDIGVFKMPDLERNCRGDTSTAECGQPGRQFDNIRRKYLLKHHQHTENSVILYASGWLQKNNAPPEAITINDEDIQALMEVTNGIGGGCLDLILHSPGGSPEAAEAIVSYLRSRFKTIRVIVPQLAMSAATMVACAADGNCTWQAFVSRSD